jgi:type IV pilus assembly protein PilF
MHRLSTIALCWVCALGVLRCGGNEASQKAIRQSDRFYEAASIAWFEEQNVLSAIRSLTRSIEINPDNHDAHYLLGIIRLGRLEYDLAEKHLREAMRLRQNGDPSGLAGVQNNLGVVLIHQKRYDEAIKLLKASSEEVMNREPWLAFGNLGWAYIEIGELDKALDALKRAMFDQPHYCVGLYRMGQVYYLKGDYAAAEVSLKQAMAVPEQGCDKIQEAHQLLGMSYLRREMREEAEGALSKCVETNKNTPIGMECAEALESL